MHPFLDGNGRTARALEALMLQRAGLRGIALQSRRMAEPIKHQIAKGLYRNLMYDLDLNELISLRAIQATRLDSGRFSFDVRLEWPTETTESEFFAQLNPLPKARTHPFPQ